MHVTDALPYSLFQLLRLSIPLLPLFLQQMYHRLSCLMWPQQRQQMCDVVEEM